MSCDHLEQETEDGCVQIKVDRGGGGGDRVDEDIRYSITVLLFILGSNLGGVGPVRGPLNSLVWYVPSLRYTRGLGWRIHCGVEVTESSTNKQHIIIINGGCRV
jgi:hypothetical protein